MTAPLLPCRYCGATPVAAVYATGNDTGPYMATIGCSAPDCPGPMVTAEFTHSCAQEAAEGEVRAYWNRWQRVEEEAHP